jgi:peptidoglycan/xylan/chitin deacetylase (PgdA/CDA1 family)
MASVLMYHAVEQSLPRADDEDYTVTRARFTRHLAIIAASATSPTTLADLLLGTPSDASRVLLTFDDGYASVLTVAAPLMAARGFAGVCFVVSDRVGKDGSLSAAQLRELESAGIAVGAHGRTHRYLTDLSPSELREELRASRSRLEDAVGHEVVTMSAPGGRFDAHVLAEARDAGYRAFFSSRPGYASPADLSHDVPRIAVTEGMSDERFERLVRNEPLAVVAPRARYALLSVPKRLLGNRGYERVRSAVRSVSGSVSWRGGAA